MKKIIVGMSGGVDSTIAAYLLKKEYEYEVIGVTMLTNPKSRLAMREVNDARKMCEKLGIKHKVVDYSDEFKTTIIDRFVNDYVNGLTPAPCSICNGKIKFKLLLDEMKKEGADFIATGHYAEVNEGAIKRSANTEKDQSYMLYSLTEDELAHLILPIGDMSKDKVRDIARSLDLEVSDKKDSQDVCFIKQAMYELTGDDSISYDYDYVEFIKEYFLGKDYKERLAGGTLTKEKIIELCPCLKTGEFIDKDKKVLGYHEGIINYTIGQRKGLNIAFGNRKYVTEIDAKNNQVVLGENDDLFKNSLCIKYDDKDTVWQKQPPLNDNEIIKAFVKVRYRDTYHPCEIKRTGDIINIKTYGDDMIRAIAPGQVAVIYDEAGNILFGGIICYNIGV